MKDTIYREDAIEAIKGNSYAGDDDYIEINGYGAIEDIRALPSADRPQEWIPCSERLPEPDKYVLLSFDNFTLAEVGRYEVDDDGGGAFYAGDDEKSYSSYGIFVNAWMPLPKPWKGADDED